MLIPRTRCSAVTLQLCSQATADEQSSLEEAADAVQVEAVGIPSISPEQLQNSFPFSKGQEVINARAAMAGFVAAVVSEVATQKSVWVQIAGRCVARIFA